MGASQAWIPWLEGLEILPGGSHLHPEHPSPFLLCPVVIGGAAPPKTLLPCEGILSIPAVIWRGCSPNNHPKIHLPCEGGILVPSHYVLQLFGGLLP